VVHGVRRVIVQRLVQALVIVEGEVLGELLAQLGDRVDIVQIQALVLDRTPQPLDEDVVQGAGRPC